MATSSPALTSTRIHGIGDLAVHPPPCFSLLNTIESPAAPTFRIPKVASVTNTLYQTYSSPWSLQARPSVSPHHQHELSAVPVFIAIYLSQICLLLVKDRCQSLSIHQSFTWSSDSHLLTLESLKTTCISLTLPVRSSSDLRCKP